MTFAVKTEPNDEEMESNPLQQTTSNLQHSAVTLENYTLDYFINSSALPQASQVSVSHSSERMSRLQEIIEVKQNELELAHERIKYLEEKMKKTSAEPGILQVQERKTAMSTRRFSELWNHFNPLQNNRAECKYCKNRLSTAGGSIGNLRRHMTKKHTGILIEKSKPNKVEANQEPLTPEKARQYYDSLIMKL